MFVSVFASTNSEKEKHCKKPWMCGNNTNADKKKTFSRLREDRKGSNILDKKKSHENKHPSMTRV